MNIFHDDLIMSANKHPLITLHSKNDLHWLIVDVTHYKRVEFDVQ